MQLHSSQKLIVHLDMNSFFATVEQQANPSLRGRPVGVCAYLGERGCVIAASIEAKKLGMKVGMRVAEARQLAPEAAFVENDPPKYRSVIARVFALLRGISPDVQPYSIDEAFVDLTGWYRDEAEAAWIMSRIKWRIREEVGDWLRCSVGIASNRLLAKIASDFKKPDGLTVINQTNVDTVLSTLELQDIWGIGHRMARRFQRHGIATPLALKQASAELLLNSFGKTAFLLWSGLHGQEDRLIAAATTSERQSIGHSYCVPSHINRDGLVLPVFMKLVERSGRRLRSLSKRTASISVAIGCASETTAPASSAWSPYQNIISMRRRLPEPVADSFTLVKAATELLQRLWNGSTAVRFLAVTFADLQPVSQQRRLDQLPQIEESWNSLTDKRQQLSDAMDRIQDKYGDHALMYATMANLGNEAPERIGFRKIDGIEYTTADHESALIH